MKLGDKVIYVVRDKHFQPCWWGAGGIIGRRGEHWIISASAGGYTVERPKYEVFPYPRNHLDWKKLPHLHSRFDRFN
jgi:hypothetical protein